MVQYLELADAALLPLLAVVAIHFGALVEQRHLVLFAGGHGDGFRKRHDGFVMRIVFLVGDRLGTVVLLVLVLLFYLRLVGFGAGG